MHFICTWYTQENWMRAHRNFHEGSDAWIGRRCCPSADLVPENKIVKVIVINFHQKLSSLNYVAYSRIAASSKITFDGTYPYCKNNILFGMTFLSSQIRRN